MPASSSRLPARLARPTPVASTRIQQHPTPPRSSPAAPEINDEEGVDDAEDVADNPKKRRFDDLCEALDSNPKKAKLVDEYKQLTHEARWVPLSISPFLDTEFTIRNGAPLPEDPSMPVEDLEEISEMSPKEIKELRYCYNALKKTITTIRENEGLWEGNSLAALIGTIDSYIGRARSDDLGQLKREVLGLIPKREGVEPLAFNNPNKSARGWAHVSTGRLLCPCNRLEEFDANPKRFCRDVENGVIQINAEDFPCFLYPEDSYNPDNVEEGLLRGEFLRSVFRSIYTGPRTATKEAPGPSAGRPSKAKQHNMTKVTPRSIAYAAIVGRFSICGQDGWALEDGRYKLEDLFNNIVELFDDPSDSWCIDTLEWWNKWVFGSSRIIETVASIDASAAPSSKATLQQQRAARRAAELAASNAGSTGNLATGSGSTTGCGSLATNGTHSNAGRTTVEMAESDSELDD
ncbi:hypothetical protein PHLCEN_2v12468 [Hermanssonia centrifuga]|uniref:Uncharacterized protein n=1 Tax=Hermanssonia centrifuga TaxID=98765 RepID=A0A2R6NGU8_9APHY|nr:hypothetical protein PHLCEN_2v12468 [Hermanssonia centrifuga]